MTDCPFRRRECGGELGDARCALANQQDDTCSDVVGEGAKLLGVLDDEDVVRVIVE
jgi:hypothetical protein